MQKQQNHCFFPCKYRHFLEVICLVQYLVVTLQKVYCWLNGTKNDTILAFSIVEHFENSGAYYGLKCTSLIVLQLQNADVTTVKCRGKLSISKNLQTYTDFPRLIPRLMVARGSSRIFEKTFSTFSSLCTSYFMPLICPFLWLAKLLQWW